MDVAEPDTHTCKGCKGTGVKKKRTFVLNDFITLRLPKDTLSELQSLADKKQTTVSALIREALTQHITPVV